MQNEEAEAVDPIGLGAETQGSCTGMFEVVGVVLPQGLSDY